MSRARAEQAAIKVFRSSALPSSWWTMRGPSLGSADGGPWPSRRSTSSSPAPRRSRRRSPGLRTWPLIELDPPMTLPAPQCSIRPLREGSGSADVHAVVFSSIRISPTGRPGM